MRFPRKVKELRNGMIAFLPFFGKRIKSKIFHIDGPYNTLDGFKYRVVYNTINSNNLNNALLGEDSIFEIYIPPLRKRKGK